MPGLLLAYLIRNTKHGGRTVQPRESNQRKLLIFSILPFEDPNFFYPSKIWKKYSLFEMLENHGCCYAGTDQDTRSKTPRWCCDWCDIVPSFAVSSHHHKDFVYSRASGMDGEPESTNKRIAAVELQIETYTTTLLHPFLITQPCGKLLPVLYTFSYLKDLKTTSQMWRYDSRRGKTWLPKDMGGWLKWQ